MDSEIKEIMSDYDIEKEEAKRAKDLMDEWDLDVEEAVDLVDEM